MARANQTRTRRRRARERQRRARTAADRGPGLATRLWQGLKWFGRRERPALPPEEYEVFLREGVERFERDLDKCVEKFERDAAAAEVAAVEAEQGRIRAELAAEERRLLAEHRGRLTAHSSVLKVAMRADPELVDAYLVYADWLQERGDPHGDLIAVQYRLLKSPEDRALRREERRLLEQLGKAYRPWPTWGDPR